jgi:hypothetical protein
VNLPHIYINGYGVKTKEPKTLAPQKRSREPDDPEQFERFVEAARKAGMDESGEAFERAFGRIVPSMR